MFIYFYARSRQKLNNPQRSESDKRYALFVNSGWFASYILFSRWVVPPYPRVINYEVFCQTRYDFHATYGLSLDGRDPGKIDKAEISTTDWLSVYACERPKGKMKLKDVNPEFYETCMVLHQKVYQEIPVNYELTLVFAIGFAYEYCKTARDCPDKEKYKVAWAIGAEATIERCKKMGSIEGKKSC